MIEVVQKPDAPDNLNSCYSCRKKFVEGDQVTTKTMPIPFRYGKQRKKAKANNCLTFMVHDREGCR